MKLAETNGRTDHILSQADALYKNFDIGKKIQVTKYNFVTKE